jgi:hypothetical protein
MLVRAEKQLAVAGDNRRIRAFAERVGGHAFKLWTGAEDETIAAVRKRVAEAVGDHHGGPIGAARAFSGQALFPDGLTGLQLETLGDPRVVMDEDQAAVNCPGADALLGARMPPKPVLLRDGSCSGECVLSATLSEYTGPGAAQTAFLLAQAEDEPSVTETIRNQNQVTNHYDVPEFMVGKRSDKIKATDVIWEFFQKHPASSQANDPQCSQTRKKGLQGTESSPSR